MAKLTKDSYLGTEYDIVNVNPLIKLQNLIFYIIFTLMYSIINKTRCVCETLTSPKHASFKKHDPDI